MILSFIVVQMYVLDKPIFEEVFNLKPEELEPEETTEDTDQETKGKGKKKKKNDASKKANQLAQKQQKLEKDTLAVITKYIESMYFKLFDDKLANLEESLWAADMS